MKNWKQHSINELAEMIKYLNSDLIKDSNDLAERLRKLAFQVGQK